MNSLSSQHPDPFSLYHAPLRAVRRWQLATLACAGAAALFALALTLVSLQPPTVIVYDTADVSRTRVVRRVATPQATPADARLFFAHMVALRYGWDSLSVKRDSERYLAACYKPERERTSAFLAETIEGAPNGKPVSRLVDFMRQGVAHAVQLPMDLGAIDCRERKERRQWDCFVKAELVTTALLSDAAPGLAPVVQPMQFVATMLEAPRSAATPYGLVMAAMHAELAEAAASAAAAPASTTNASARTQRN